MNREKTKKGLEDLLSSISENILNSYPEKKEIEEIPSEGEFQVIINRLPGYKNDNNIAEYFLEHRNETIISAYLKKGIIQNNKETIENFKKTLETESGLITLLYKKKNEKKPEIGTVTLSISPLDPLTIPSKNYEIETTNNENKTIGDIITKHIKSRKENENLTINGICEISRLATTKNHPTPIHVLLDLRNIIQIPSQIILHHLKDYFIMIGCDKHHTRTYKKTGLKEIFQGKVKGINTPYCLLLGHNDTDYKSNKVDKSKGKDVPLYFINTKDNKMYQLNNVAEKAKTNIKNIA